jgi:RNA polymerase sigma-70 factor (ECF subfamily)
MFVTSQSLLQRLTDRADGAAWRRLVDLYEPWLRGWLARQGMQPADAEDVLQDVFVVVSEQLPRFVHNGRPGAFRAWMRAILTHRARHFQRTRRNREGRVASLPPGDWVDQLEDPASALSGEWDREHDRQLVRRLLAGIRPEFGDKTWRVFQMLVLEDRPVAEVAAALGITANSVYVAKATVLARLRAELKGLVDL